MFITEDLLKDSPLEAICNMINDKFLLDLNYLHVVLVSLEQITTLTTRIKLKRDVSSDEVLSFTFSKINLTNHFGSLVNVSVKDLPINSKQLIESLLPEGSQVCSSDLEELSLDEFGKTFTIKANPESLRFRGSVNVLLVDGYNPVVENKNSLFLPDLHLIDNVKHPTLNNASFMVYSVDFSRVREILRQANGTFPDPKWLAGTMSEYSGHNFVGIPYIDRNNIVHTIDPNPQYKVVYNGPTTGCNFAARKDLENVLILELNTAFCIGSVGNLMLHYN